MESSDDNAEGQWNYDDKEDTVDGDREDVCNRAHETVEQFLFGDACYKGCFKCISERITNNIALVNQPCLSGGDRYHHSPLFYACDGNRLKMAQYLLQNGANPHDGELYPRSPEMTALLKESIQGRSSAAATSTTAGESNNPK